MPDAINEARKLHRCNPNLRAKEIRSAAVEICDDEVFVRLFEREYSDIPIRQASFARDVDRIWSASKGYG